MAERREVFDMLPVELADRFLRLTVQAEGFSVSSRLFVPEGAPGERFPLLVYLHGAGERGTDNEVQLLTSRAAYVFAGGERPCLVLAPQVPPESSPLLPEFEKPFMQTLRRVLSEYPADRRRVYISGVSMGAMGVWRYITRYPALFAAAVPISGAGDLGAVSAARSVPVWAFHAEDDSVVPADRIESYGKLGLFHGAGSRLMTEALRGCGGTVRYTEYPTGYIAARFGFPQAYAGHFASAPAYLEPELPEWLFSQSLPD